MINFLPSEDALIELITESVGIQNRFQNFPAMTKDGDEITDVFNLPGTNEEKVGIVSLDKNFEPGR